MLALPLLLAAVPPSALDRGPVLCPIRRLTGRPCPGCGMTRALSAALHGDLRRAWRYNRLVLVVGPILAGMYLRELLGPPARRAAGP